MGLPLPAWCYECKCFIQSNNRSRSHFLCSSCFQKLRGFDPSICLKCGRRHQPSSCRIEWAKHIRRVYALFSYEDPVRNWISSLKYNRNFVTGRLFQWFVSDWFSSHSKTLNDLDLLVPIPLHPGKLNKRGFNQAVYLLNQQTQLRIATSLLLKKTATPPQAGKSSEERKKNLRNAFCVSGEVSGKNVLLFDDVCTTGQTLAEAAQTLKQSGANQIDALVLCRSLQVG